MEDFVGYALIARYEWVDRGGSGYDDRVIGRHPDKDKLEAHAAKLNAIREAGIAAMEAIPKPAPVSSSADPAWKRYLEKKSAAFEPFVEQLQAHDAKTLGGETYIVREIPSLPPLLVLEN